MKTAVSAAILGAAAVAALPTKRGYNVTDTDILQYALTLEHLENYFYSTFLGQFDAGAFAAAGFPDWVRGRLVQIGEHEAQHVALLSGALGSAATQPCTYSFPTVQDPATFVGLATIVENVGVSAYLGAASSITEAAYVTVAGSILTTEARHQAWLNSAVEKHAAWSGPEDTPLDFNEVYSIAAGFITSCPASNPALPFKAFPSLTIAATGAVSAGGGVSCDGTYVLLVAGLEANTFPVVNGGVQNFPQPQGISYAVLTTESDPTKVSDDNIVAGPMIFDFPFDSKVDNPAPNF